MSVCVNEQNRIHLLSVDTNLMKRDQVLEHQYQAELSKVLKSANRIKSIKPKFVVFILQRLVEVLALDQHESPLVPVSLEHHDEHAQGEAQQLYPLNGQVQTVPEALSPALLVG